MDLTNIEKIMYILQKIFWTPFLIAFGAGSRICWDYLEESIIPTKRKIWSLFILSSFSATVFILIMKAQGMSRANIDIGILIISFLGHTTWTWIMENKNEIFRRLTGLSRTKKDEDK